MERNEFTLDELHSGMMLRDSSRSQPFSKRYALSVLWPKRHRALI